MKNIMITGSMGYLGSVLIDFLIQRGYNCIGYDIGFFKNSLLYEIKENGKSILKDARDIREKDLESIDVVIHLAGISNDPMGNLNSETIYDPTRIYSLEIAKMCKKMGVRFIFASSCSIYGIGANELLNENSEVFPQTGYSLNKLQIEQDLSSISDINFSPIALRFATVFGLSPRLRFDVVINMLTGMAVTNKTIILNSDGKAWRPNIHIQDICKSIQCAIDFEYNDGKLLVLNVGSNENNLQVIEIAKIIQQIVPGCQLKFLNENPQLDSEGLIKDRKVNQGIDNRTYKVSFEKIKMVMPNFYCEWTIEKGVEQMASFLHNISFDSNKFKKREFYRLQQLEHLYLNGYLSKDLRWLKTFS